MVLHLQEMILSIVFFSSFIFYKIPTPNQKKQMKDCLANQTEICPKIWRRKRNNYSTHIRAHLVVSSQGLRARAIPTLALFSIALESTSPETVKNDFGRHSCWISALATPALFTRAFTVVNGSIACWVPTVMAFSFVVKLWLISAPTTVLVNGFTIW